ncbi:MAG: hypothetical protein ABSB65_09660 [Candidatus Acidiferrales bacterium]|jgi:hypothetical protein
MRALRKTNVRRVSTALFGLLGQASGTTGEMTKTNCNSLGLNVKFTREFAGRTKDLGIDAMDASAIDMRIIAGGTR